jgi:hypothetical protein
MYSKDINMQQEPKEYFSLHAAYSSIREQYHPDFAYQVVNIYKEPSKNKEVYYIDVMDKEQGNWVGYLGDSYE